MDTPSIDTRAYKHFTLSNGLSCLVIHDEETDKAAASIAVGVGQLQDDNLPGLAHLTEHLLTMGTETFQDENFFDKYLSESGGHNNAYTDLECTCYYLDCQAPALEGALERFASCFICPLLSKNTVEREIQAVDSEHAKNIQSDSWRLHQLNRTILGQSCNHPYGSFGTGNKKSLGAHDNDTLANAVRVFYERYYRTINMTLCVLGKQPINELEEWVEKYFTAVPAGDEKDHKPKPLPPFTPTLPKQLDTVPISEITTMELHWPMRETQTVYESKPTRFLSHLIGHESPGSLLAALRDKHWAQELVADDASKSCHGFSIFSIDIELTASGLENINKIVSMVYAYLALLKDIPEWVFDELKAASDMQFRFLSKRPPADFVSSLSVQMQHFPPQRFLSGPYKLFTDSLPTNLISEFWKDFTPDNMLLVVSAKELEGSTDQTDPFYGTEYKEKEIDKQLLNEWSHAIDDPDIVSMLRLPDQNDMLATNFDLVKAHPAYGEEKSLPRCLVDTPTCRLWYKPDTVFSQPKVNIILLLRTCVCYATSPVNSVLGSMWVEVMQEHCKDFSYFASMAGLYLDFQNTRSGIEIHLSGYNHKIENLLQRVTQASVTMPEALTDEIFARIIDKMRNQFSMFLVGQPYQHAIYAADLCLEDLKWEMKDRISCLDDINLNDLKHFSKTLLSRFRTEILVHGNVSGGEAMKLSQMILDVWEAKPPYHLPVLRVAHLESDCVYRFRGWNEEDSNSCVLNLFQIGPVDYRTNAALSVLQHLVREPAFNQLRTEEQLGYIVHTSIKTSGSGASIKGWLCLIQSDSFDPIHMDSRIEAFLVKMRSLLVDLSREEFETNVEAVRRGLTEKDKNLGEESTKYWNVIANETYRFRRLEEIAAKAEGLTKEDVLRLFDKHLLAKSPFRRKLSVQVFGKNHADLLNSEPSSPPPTVIDDPKSFCQSQSLFPVEPAVCIDEQKLSID